MALYIDSAYLDDIATVTRTLPLAGVTTNPSIVLAAQQRGQSLSLQDVLQRLLKMQSGAVFVQPSIADEEHAYFTARSYAEINPERILLKIPINQAGMRLALRLKAERLHIAFTAVTSVTQAYAGAMAQADFVIPYYNRMQRSSIDAQERVSQMAKLLHNQQLPTRILAASIKSPTEAAQALLAGAHDLTVPPQVLLDMVTDPDSEEAITKFEQDWQKLV